MPNNEQKKYGTNESVNDEVEEVQAVNLIDFKNSIAQIIRQNGSKSFKKAVLDSELISNLLFDKRRAVYLLWTINSEWKKEYKLSDEFLDLLNETIISFVRDNFTKQESVEQFSAFFGDFKDMKVQQTDPKLYNSIMKIFKIETAKQSNNNNSNLETSRLKQTNRPAQPSNSIFFANKKETSLTDMIKGNNQQFNSPKPNEYIANTGLNYDHAFILTLRGDPGVGKSLLLMRWAEGKYTEAYVSTIGVDLRMRFIEVNGKKIKLQVWDTPGDERLRTVGNGYDRGTHAWLYVIDVTDLQSFNNLGDWMRQQEKVTLPGTLKILIAAKCDLQNKQKVEFTQLEDFANKHGFVGPILTSAKTGQGVEEAFQIAAAAVLEKIAPVENISNSNNDRSQNRSCNIM